MKRILFIILCLHGFASGSGGYLHAADRPDRDSLLAVWHNPNLADTNRMDALHALANLYIVTNLDSMYFFADQQLVLAQSSGNKAAEGRARQVLGSCYLKKGELEKAFSNLRSGLVLSKEAGITYMIGKTSHELATAFRTRRELDSASYYYHEALTIMESLGNQRGVAAALGGLGGVFQYRGKFDLALSNYMKALDVFEEIGDQQAKAAMLRNVAFIHVMRTDYESALSYCHQSLNIFESSGDQTGVANACSSIGLIFYYQTKYDSALIYQQRSAEINEELGNKRGMSSSYGNLGMIYDQNGDTKQALAYYERSLKLKEEVGDKAGIANTLRNISKVYRDLGDYEQTLVYTQKSVMLFEETGDKARMAGALHSMAWAYLQTGEDSLAQLHARQSLALGKELGGKRVEVNALLVIAAISRNEGKADSARLFYQQALQMAEETRQQEEIGIASNGLARLAMDQENWQLVNKYAQRSLDIALEAESVSRIESSAGILWRSQEALGQKVAAFETYKLYIQMRDSLSSITNQRAAIRYEFQQQALADSLESAARLNAEVAENKRRQTVSYFLLAGLGITLLFGGILYNRFRLTSRQKAKLGQANGELNAANEKLKELDNFKSRFFTNISHEFRTPLTVITGMTQQVQQQPDKWLDKGIKLIDRNAQSLLHLINQILDLRKLESGNLTLSPIQADVVQALRLSTASFESMAESKNVELGFEAEKPELMMDFDPDKLGQIANNLLSNAIKFTPEGGNIRLRTYPKTEDQLVIEVEDSGRGIPADKLPYIFDRFYQVDGTDTRQGEGTGVGLSLTKELVSLMEGEIAVESEAGKGSKFVVTLPVSQQAETAESILSPPLASPVFPKALPALVSTESELPRLLIVEDNPDIVSYLYSLLEEEYVLSNAPDGQAGIEAALEQVPDLIITDVMMPRKNGYELTETLKLDERTSHIPIVMLTAKADQDSKLEGYKRGADAYLAKPFDQQELLVRLEKLWEIRQRLQQRYQSHDSLPQTEDETEVVEDAFIIRVRTQILAKVDDPTYKRDALGADLGLSNTNLNRKLKALTGLSTGNYIRKVRLIYAKELIKEQPELQISEVAYSTGFNDPAYFSRAFHEEHGLSPVEFKMGKGKT